MSCLRWRYIIGASLTRPWIFGATPMKWHQSIQGWEVHWKCTRSFLGWCYFAHRWWSFHHPCWGWSIFWASWSIAPMAFCWSSCPAMVSTIGRGSALVPELNYEEKCIGKTKAFSFWRGAQYASFFSGVEKTTDRGQKLRKFDAIKILGFFDLNRWWIQQETAPRFYTFGHLWQHPALGALYRVFWPKWSFRHPTKTLRLEVGCLGGWMSNKNGCGNRKTLHIAGCRIQCLTIHQYTSCFQVFFIGLHLSLLCRRFRRVR